MKLETSDKTSSYGKKPHVKKGYYPAKLISVEPFTDKEGTLREGKYGRQLIFQFGIYKADPETGKPIEQINYVPDENVPNTSSDVVIPKFVYHEYKDPKSGEFQTAITPNSAITKILKALGWEFTGEGIEIDDYLGKFVEVNIDDYDQKADDTTYVASTIKDISAYKGPSTEDVPSSPKKESQTVKKQIKHEDVKDNTEVKESEEVKVLRSKIIDLEKLNKEKLLTDEGLAQAKVQLESQIKDLLKK